MCSARLEASAAQQCPFLLITSSVIKSGDGNSAVLQQHLGGNRQYGILFEVCFFPVQDEYLNIYGKLLLQIFAGFCLLQKSHHPRLVILKFQAVPQFAAVALNTKRQARPTERPPDSRSTSLTEQTTALHTLNQNA